MPDDTNNQSNNQSNSSNNQQQQNNTSSQAANGKKIVLGADNGCSQSDCDKIKQALENCGNTVSFTCIDPNQESYMKGHGADLGVFFVNGVAPATMWSFVNAIKAGSLPFTIFAHPGWAPYHDPNEPQGTLASLDTVRAVKFEPEWDAGQFMSASSTAQMQSDANGATTIGEWADQNSQYFALCWGASAEELAQNICNGACGSGAGGGGSTVNAGGGAQIKDKTFEKCIRRICAATDSIFLVENNAAVLFPYTDWMALTLRQKINAIKSDEIDPDVFSIDYGNEGFYNKVSIAWGGGTLPERFSSKEESRNQVIKDKKTNVNYTVEDILKNMSLTNFVYDNKKQEASTTTTNKDKTTQKVSVDSDGTTILSEQYDSLVEKYGELEKRVESAAPDLETAQYIVNALLIQYVRDFNSSCKCRAINVRKYIGGTFYAVENPSTKQSELFYLNGYTIRTQKNEPLYHDLDFRYGPEGAEELLDYQTLSGGAAAGGATTNTGGGSATEEQIWQHAAKFCHFWSCGELRESESDTQDPQVAEDYVNKKEKANTPKICLSCYGMSAWLYYQFNYKANIPCQVVGNSGHHVVMIDRGNGMVSTEQEYRQLDKGFRWSDQGTGVLLAAPSNTTSSGGNTSNNNANGGNS